MIISVSLATHGRVRAVFPDQKPINRTLINSWEDRRVVEAVMNTGRKN